MPRGIPNAVKVEEADEVAVVLDTSIRLDRHYRPRGDYEVIGFHKAAVTKKNAAGMMIEVEPAEFIKGEIAPAPFPGVGYDHKVWAGTIIKLPKDEAKPLVRSGVASLEFDEN